MLCESYVIANVHSVLEDLVQTQQDTYYVHSSFISYWKRSTLAAFPHQKTPPDTNKPPSLSKKSHIKNLQMKKSNQPKKPNQTTPTILRMIINNLSEKHLDAEVLKFCTRIC